MRVPNHALPAVLARHLRQFDFQPTVCYPRRTDKDLYHRLVKQCEGLGIPFVSAEELLSQPLRCAMRSHPRHAER